MEVKDLRIGNFVYGVSDRIEKISYITEKYVKTNLLKIDAESQLLEYKDIEQIPLTEEWVLKFEQFDKTDKEGTPCFFNGDNIMLFDRGGCFDAYLHSEVNGDIFFATRLFYVHQLQNFYHAIERQELTIKE